MHETREFKNKKEMVKEIINCGKSPAYFIKKYIKIQHPLKGLIPFATFQYQDDLLEGFVKHRFNIVLKARQVGITSLMGAFIAWFILFHKDKNVLVVSTKQETAKNVIRAVKVAFANLPKWLVLANVSTNNKQSIELSNGSRVKATTTASDVGRSEALSLLIVDEAAHIRTLEENWIGLWPTLSLGGRAILSSTPNGAGGLYHKIYQQAQAGENTFNCKFGKYINPNNKDEIYDDRFLWWVHPDHDQPWFENETMGRSRREIAQEYECSFLASGDTFIFPADIVRLEKLIREPIEKTNFDRNLWIYEYPVKGAVYLINSDISRGDAKDYSAFHVLRLDGRLKQVAEYKGKITPDILGLVLIETSKKYNNAIISVENNGGWSGQAIMKIRENNYPFLYYTPKRKNEFIDMYYVQQISNDPYLNGNDYATPGYTVTPLNRIPMLAKMENYIRNGHIDIYSSRLVEEFRTFVWVNNKPEASKGYNDDLIMALAGATWVREESFMAVSRANDMNKLLLTGISSEQTTTSDVPSFNFNGSNVYDKNRIKQFAQEKNQLVISGQPVEDLNWLLDARIPIYKG